MVSCRAPRVADPSAEGSGVSAWAGYRAAPIEGSTILARGQVLDGMTPDDTLAPRISLGQKGAAEGAYYPNFGAVYSNVEVWADIQR